MALFFECMPECARKLLDTADIVIALGKVWKRRNRRGNGETSCWNPAGVSPARSQSSRQAGSECCHSPGDRWVRSVHSKEAGREDSAPKTRLVAMPTPLTRRKAALGRPIMRGRPGVAGVPSSGHASKGISQEPRRAPPSPPHYGRYRSPRETGGDRER